MSKGLLYFAGGVVVGFVCGYLIGQKIRRNGANPAIDEKYVRQDDEAGERVQNTAVRPSGARRAPLAHKGGQNIEEKQKGRSVALRASEGHSSEVDPRPPVRDIVANVVEPDSAEREAPIERAHAERLDEEQSDEWMNEWPEEMTARARKNEGRRPRIISADTLGDLDGTWDTQVLYYYTYDDTLTTEEGEVIENILWAVGDCLEKYGFTEDTSQREVIVQNFDLNTVYEVVKVIGEFDPNF